MSEQQPVEIALLYRRMRETSTVLAFSGVVSQDVVVGLGETLRGKLGEGDESPQAVRRLFSIFVELAQNVLAHSAERVAVGGRQVGMGIVLIRDAGDHWIVSSGNPVDAARAGALAERCRVLNAADTAELRRLRREQLRSDTAPGPGAGVGLMEIARTAGHPLRLCREPVADGSAFVVLEVRLDKEPARA